jgi:hypothetical protein
MARLLRFAGRASIAAMKAIASGVTITTGMMFFGE